MRSESEPVGQPKTRTFIETARRAQIVAAAIDAIAELGYAQASLARIAATAGTSKGVIIYHFGTKDDLIREVVAELRVKGRAYLGPRLEAELTGAGMLRTYIEANLAFIGENRNHVLATVEIAFNARSADGGSLYDFSNREEGAEALRQILVHFQGTGEFRADFDPAVMSMTIRAALDAVPARLARDPGLDLDRYGRELADLFHIATRPEGSHPRQTTRGAVTHEQSAEEP
jgi:AcrR family transcriptional regulator